jgi:hypothetical protein
MEKRKELPLLGIESQPSSLSPVAVLIELFLLNMNTKGVYSPLGSVRID